jgi:hypothetical protein
VGDVIGALRPAAPGCDLPAAQNISLFMALIMAVIGSGVFLLGQSAWAGLVFVVVGSVAVAGPVVMPASVAPTRLLRTDTAIRGQERSGL